MTTPAPLPPLINTLEPRALLMQFDFEGTRGKENYLPGCALSVGAAVFNWPHRELFRPRSRPHLGMFRVNIVPTVEMDEVRTEWWNRSEHKAALLANTHNPVEAYQAAREFAAWCHDFTSPELEGYGPIVAISEPHDYDGQMMADLLAHLPPHLRPNILFASNSGLLAALTGHDVKVAKSAFKHFLPKQLHHVPDMDSFEQGMAFWRALTALTEPGALSKLGLAA